MAFQDLLNKLDSMAQQKRNQPDDRLIKLQEEVSRKIGVPLEGVPSSEDEIIQKASAAIQARHTGRPKSLEPQNPLLRALDIASRGITKGMTFGLNELVENKIFGGPDPTRAVPRSDFERALATSSNIAGGAVSGGKIGEVIAPAAKVATSKVLDLARAIPAPVKIAGTGAGIIGGTQAVMGATRPELKDSTLATRTGASLRAGVGDVLATAGGVAKWRGKDELGETLTGAGERLREGYEIPYGKEFTWRSFFDPQFYSTTAARSLPFTASLIPAMYAGWKIGGATGAKVGLGPFQKAILSSMAGAGLSRPLESALEAGSAYEEALARGMSQQEADRAANEVFKRNLALAGLDAAQLAAAFAPLPAKPATTAGRIALGAGRLGIEAATEAGEEGYQEAVQRQALGTDERGILEQILHPSDSAMKEAMGVGAIFGAGMGGAGDIVEVVRERARAKLPPEYQNKTDDEIAQDPQGRQAIQEAVEEVTQEMQQPTPPEPVPAPGEVKEPVPAEAPPRQPVIRDVPRESRSGVLLNETIMPPEEKPEVKAEEPEKPETAQPQVEDQSVQIKEQPQAKEPWEMTKGEYLKWYDEHWSKEGVKGVPADLLWADKNHKFEVEQAIQQGKPVPSEVLADYPELAKQLDAKSSQETPGEATVEPQAKEEATQPKKESPYKVGDRVRYTPPEGEEWEGTVESIDNGVLGVRRDGDPYITLATTWDSDQIQKVESRTQETQKTDPRIAHLIKFADKTSDPKRLADIASRIRSVGASEAISKSPKDEVMAQAQEWADKIETRAKELEGTKVNEYTVYRRDIKNADLSASKPHGLYLSFVRDRSKFKSPHKDVGDTDYWGTASPKNPLIVEDIKVKHKRFGRSEEGKASAGVAALKKLLPENEFNRLLTLNKQQMIDLLDKQFPDPDYTRYHDAYELLEVYAANLARKKGYDAIILEDNSPLAKLGGADFSEFIALTDDIVSFKGKEPSTTQQAPVATLADYGLEIRKTTTKTGKTAFELSGNTQEYKDVIKRLNARWYGPKKVWTFYTEEDPTGKILKALAGAGYKPAAKEEVQSQAEGTKEAIPKEEKTTKEPETGVESKQENLTLSVRIANFVKERLKNKQTITSSELFKFAESVYGGSQAEGKFTPKDAYDAMELGVNLYLLEHKKSVGPLVSVETAKRNIENIRKEILEKLPTQTKRTQEMDEFQQFSTPPNLAYVAAWTANITNKDTVLEPSAGVGGLAVFGKTAGAKVIVNELSQRRATLLKELGFDRVFTENAEQLNNILPADVKPTVVLMNPPFSSTAGRLKGKTNTKNAIPHIEQALKRLEDGGRLVAIVGRGMSEDAASFEDWWKKIKQQYNVRANIGIDGKNYAKYGTSFDVQLVVIDKTGPTQGGTITGSVTELEDVLPLLEGVKNDRGPVEQEAAESGSQGIPQEGQTKTGSEHPVPVPADRVGTGEGGRVGKRTERSEDRVGRSVRGQGGTGEVGLPGIGEKTDVLEPSREGHGPAPEERADRLPGRRAVVRPEGAGEEEVARGRGAVPGGESASGTDGKRAAEQPAGLNVEAMETPRTEKELTDAVYTPYQPQKLKIPGAKPHPGNLAQSAAMAAVESPEPTYTPNLPKEVIQEGKLSIAQLESVVYAGQSHQQTLPNGQRRGFFIGDGTGVGKGREISGIILDNMRQGRKKAVWVSKNYPLFNDARRDFGDIGGNPELIFDFSKIKLGVPVKQKEGVLFTTYTTLGQGLSSSREGTIIAKEGQKARIDQIVQWLGEDFDGVIAFDEAHEMQNSLAVKGKRGMTKPSTKALAGVELQRRLPNARVVYVSATGATDVINLAYADRLGLWGEGTPFADKRDFINKIQAGGLAAMELVARDMKAMGVYIARNLGYNGVTYGTLEHQLTPEQLEVYDAMADGWQIVLQNLHTALEETGQKSDGNAKGRALAKFWGAHQRFFNQVLTSMQMPSVIKQVKEDLKNGKAVVMQLVNTNEAAQNRQIAKVESAEELDNLDLTPRDMLMQYLDKSFPTQQYEEYTDENGNTRSRPVTDSHGHPVENQEAVARKEELMAKLGAMKVPEGPLEIVLNTFGPDNVAEITGRRRRVVRVKDESGRTKAKLENRTPKHVEADADAFMNDKKHILIFSDAGGTGRSYHAALTAKNQRQRVHYLIQAGWRADAAVQGFGRTHRSNQANAPHYVLVTTNLKGQKRFISSIARKLDQLGALTKGQRQTGSQGLFSAKDNLENDLARDALQRFYEDLTGGQIQGLKAQDVLTKMGLDKLVDNAENLKEVPETRDIQKFLNRILSLESTLQNRVFDAFYQRLEDMVEIAIKNGTLDVGLENFRADKVKIVEEKTVYTDEKSGAETKYIGLEAGYKIHPFPFSKALKLPSLLGFYQNTRSGRVYAVRKWGQKTLESGNVVKTYKLYGQVEGTVNTIDEQQLKRGNWKELTSDEARNLWNDAIEKLEEYRKENVHLISGAILPIWDRLPQGNVRVIRVRTDDGRMFLGRIIPERAIDITLKRLGATRDKEELSPAETVDKILQGYTVYLANEWKIVKRRVSGENRIEIIGNDLYRYMDQLKSSGVFTERIQYETRFFIPTGEKAAEVFANVTKYRPVVDVVAPAKARGGDTFSLSRAQPGKKQKKQQNSTDFITDPEEHLNRLSPKAAREISERLAKALDTVLRAGRVHKQARGASGTFSKKTGTGRIKKQKLDNWRTMGHELGHALQFKGGFKPHRSEMWSIAEEFYPGKIPQGKKTAEGLAEFLTLWFVDNAKAREMAPRTTAKLEAFLDANPELGKVFDDALAIAENDLEGSALARMANAIAKPGKRLSPNIGEEYRVPWWKRLTFSLIDYTLPLKDLYEAATKKGYEGLDPAKIAAVSGMTREKAIKYFESAARDDAGRFLVPGKRSLKEIVEEAAEIPGGVELMDWVYHALRYEERYQRGFKDAPYPESIIKAAADEARRDYPHIVKLVEEYSEILSEINLRALVRGGVISEETAERVRKGSTYYLPLYHTGKPTVSGAESKRRAAGPGLQRYRGHSGQTMNFIEASLTRLNDTLLAVEINRTMQAIEGTLRQKNMGLFGEIIDRPQVIRGIGTDQLNKQLEDFFSGYVNSDIEDEERIIRLFMPGGISDIKSNEPILMARHGDKQTFMRVAPDIYEAVLAMKPLTIDWLGKALAVLAQVGRFGALANIRYVTNAMARDIVGSNIQSQTPERSMVLGYLRGAIAAAGGDKELMDLYIQSGAYGSSAQEVLNSLIRSSRSDGLFNTPAPGWKRTATGIFTRVVRFPWEALRVLEEAPRVPEFEAMLKKGLKEHGLTMDDLLEGRIPDDLAEEVEKVLIDAAYASREVAVNFSLHGTHEGFRRYARTVPFLQGGIQGVYREFRQVRDKPGATLMRWLIYVLPITLIAWALSHKDDRYRDMPSESRDTYWWFPVSEDGQFYISVAKPYGYALPANILERFLDWAVNSDDPNRRKPFEDLTAAVKKAGGFPVASMVVETVLGLMTNKNYFGSPIVPEREENSLPQVRYGPGNTKAAIKMAEILARLMGDKGPSPRQIDYFVNNVFGGVGKSAMKTLSGTFPWESDREGKEYAPVVGPLLYGPNEGGSRIVDRFYQDYKKAQMLYKTVRDLEKRGKTPAVKVSDKDVRLVRAIPAMRAIANDLSDLRGKLRAMDLDADVTPEQKRIANLRYKWYSKVAAGYLYGRPVPVPPKEAGITPAHAQDILDHLGHITQQAIERAKKRKGGPI